MELAFGIDSYVGCWMIVSLLVATTNIAAPDADASDELHQQLIKINIRQKLYNYIELLFSKLEAGNCVNSVLDYADLALELLEVHTCLGPSIYPIRV